MPGTKTTNRLMNGVEKHVPQFASDICNELGWLAPARLPGSDIYATCIELCQETANQVLARCANPDNRKLSELGISACGADAKNGRWYLTHQGLAFDRTGRLIDGHHRTTMVARSGITIPTLVFFNLDTAALKAIDIGRMRTMMQVAKMMGMQFTQRTINVVRWMLPEAQTKTYSPEQMELLHEVLGDSIPFVCQWMNRKVKGVTSAAVLGAFGTAYFHEEQERLIEFARVLTTGDPEGCSDYSGALSLYRKLRSRDYHSGSLRTEAFHLTQAAIHRFCRREKVQNLAPMFKSNLYQLPEEIIMAAKIILDS